MQHISEMWLWVKNRLTPKWLALVNGTKLTKTCGSIPGGLILTHTHVATWRPGQKDVDLAWFCACVKRTGLPKLAVVLISLETPQRMVPTQQYTPTHTLTWVCLHLMLPH